MSIPIWASSVICFHQCPKHVSDWQLESLLPQLVEFDDASALEPSIWAHATQKTTNQVAAVTIVDHCSLLVSEQLIRIPDNSSLGEDCTACKTGMAK
jgi:hypothetical protein